MKKISYIFGFIVLLTSCGASQNLTQIDQKLDSPKGREIVLQQVMYDSRCPEEVQCIWAGEVTILVAVYEQQKLVEQTTLTLNPNNQDEIVSWFAKRLPDSKKSLRTVSVVPYPKQDVVIDKKDYKIVLGY